jgi:hypothetical protein
LKNLTPEGGKVLKKSSGKGPYVLRTDKVRAARDGNITRRCKAITVDGPCRNWTNFEFCHMHEWKVNEAVLSTRQSFVLLFPRAVARLARLIDEPDGETALKAIMVCLKYMLGDKTIAEGMQQGGGLAELSTEELVERAQRAITALQHPPKAGVQGSESCTNAPTGTQAGPGSVQPTPAERALDGL